MLDATKFRGLLGALFAAGLTLFATACPPPAETPDAGPQAECEVPRDCGAGYDCLMGDEGVRVCVKLFCTNDTDCPNEGEHCDLRRGLCLGDGCLPGVEGSCPSGKVCLDGACQDPPPGADSCAIAPGSAIVRSGETVALSATGFMNSGALAPLAEFSWASADDSCLTVVDGVVSGAGSDTCTAEISATPVGGGSACTANVTNFPAVALPALRALIIDEMSGAPVAGATLLVRTDDGAGGTVTELPTVTSDAQGVATIADIGTSAAGNLLDVSVFHNDFSYVTVVRPETSDLVFPMQALPDPTHMAGVKGDMDFSGVHTEGDISLGLAGMSIPGSLTDMDFLAMMGETVPRDIHLEGVGDFEDAPLPSGLYMKVGAADIKADYQAFGLPGKRILWGLGGKVRLSEIGPIISQVAGGTGELDIGGILSAVLPYFSTFDHAVIGNLDLPSVTHPSSGEPSDWDFGTTDQTLVLDTLLSQSATYTIPTLPLSPGSDKHIEGAVMLMGAVVPGQGTVPLGLTAGLDAPNDSDTADGVIDPMDCPENNPGCIRPARGQMIADFAPPHGGLEGSQYIALVMALGMEAIGEAQFTSILVNVSDTVDTSSTNSFAAGTFLEFPNGGAYIPGMSYQQSAPVAGVDFYRLNLEDDNNQGWAVYFNDAVSGVTLPTPPSGFADRSATADVQSFQTFGNGAFGVGELFGFNDSNLDNLINLTAGFSTMECVHIEQPVLVGGGCPDGYTADTATGLCVGGPTEISAFAAGSSSPCDGMTGYEPVYTDGEGSAGICARTPSCRLP